MPSDLGYVNKAAIQSLLSPNSTLCYECRIYSRQSTNCGGSTRSILVMALSARAAFRSQCLTRRQTSISHTVSKARRFSILAAGMASTVLKRIEEVLRACSLRTTLRGLLDVGVTGRAFELARKTLAPSIELKEIDLPDLSPETVGRFDVVLFAGVLYHLRHPLYELERVAKLVNSELIVETHIDAMDFARPARVF